MPKEDSQSFTGAVDGFDEDRSTVKVLVLSDCEVMTLLRFFKPFKAPGLRLLYVHTRVRIPDVGVPYEGRL